MSDYYDPHPRVRLDRPIVLAGQVGCGSAAVGRNVAAQTGLSFEEIDRSIEHQAGRSLARLAAEQGMDRMAARVDALLAQRMDDMPFGLIILDLSWPTEAVRDLLSRRAHLIHIRRSRRFLRRRLDVELERSGDWILGGTMPPAGAELDFDALLARREAILCDAETVLEAGDLHANRVAAMLLDSLERIVEVDPC